MSKPQEDRSIKVPEELVKELLTASELRMVKQRLLILKLLEEGRTIRSIAEEAHVGTDTVVRMARKLESNPGLRRAFNKYSQKSSSPSKWVFGQVGSEEE